MDLETVWGDEKWPGTCYKGPRSFLGVNFPFKWILVEPFTDGSSNNLLIKKSFLVEPYTGDPMKNPT